MVTRLPFSIFSFLYVDEASFSLHNLFNCTNLLIPYQWAQERVQYNQYMDRQLQYMYIQLFITITRFVTVIFRSCLAYDLLQIFITAHTAYIFRNFCRRRFRTHEGFHRQLLMIALMFMFISNTFFAHIKATNENIHIYVTTLCTFLHVLCVFECLF